MYAGSRFVYIVPVVVIILKPVWRSITSSEQQLLLPVKISARQNTSIYALPDTPPRGALYLREVAVYQQSFSRSLSLLVSVFSSLVTE